MPGSFSDWLKSRRKELDLTQKELAERVGYAPVSIQKIEEGKRRPSKQMAALLAAQLAVGEEEHQAFIRAAREGKAPAAASTGSLRLPVTLPAPLTPMINRDHDLAAIQRLFNSGGRRLLTILGPPGVGKTRLSLAVAWQVAEQFEDGATFTRLASISGAGEAVAAAVLDTLNLQAPEMEKSAVLRDYLAARDMFLVLDNFEHVLEAAGIVGELLSHAPRLRILVTSREPLRLYGEARYILSPLPTVTMGGSGYDLSPAAQLFTARVRDLLPDFAVTIENKAVVDAICARLDGLPLALELAAVQASRQPLPDLLAGLEQCLEMLRQQRGNVPPRHLSLQSAVSWSTNLLNADRRRSFYMLGLFSGSFTPEAAAAVTGRPDLPDLVAASLVQSADSQNGRPRFTLLETMREMALSGLSGLEDAEAARRRYARFFVDLAGQAFDGYSTAGMPQWQLRLAMEKDNVRNVLAGCQDYDSHLGLLLSRHMSVYWYLWGEYRQGVQWLDCFLEKESTPTILRGEALNGAGVLLTRFGEFERARGYFTEALTIGRDQAHVETICRALIGLAETDNARGDFQAGLPRYQEALGFFERLDNNFGISWALGGLAAYEENANNDLHAAAEIMTTSVAYARQQPDIRHLGWFLCILADLQRDLDRLDEARRNLAEGLALLVETADRPGQAFSKLRLAGLALQEGLLARARPFLCDTISLSYDTYTLSYAAQGIYLAGLLLLHRGEIEGGLRLCAAAETIYPPVRRRLLRSDLAAIDRQIDEVKSRLGEVKFVRLWNEGSVYRLPAAVELALLLL